MKILSFEHRPQIVASATAVGKSEADGPLCGRFDLVSRDGMFGAKTWETAEAESQRLALGTAIDKCGGLVPEAVFAGDLVNQCTPSAFGLCRFGLPFFGLYGACSTIVEGLMLAALLVDSGHARTAAAVTSSHFCTAERQFRTPLEYGGQRSPTAQHTVTGSAAFIVAADRKGDAGTSPQKTETTPRIVAAMPGIITDGGITDQSNMGAAMAPAALRTLSAYFASSGRRAADYDFIVTGDLGSEGHSILCELADANGIDLADGGCDCCDGGLIIYDRTSDDVHSGGSGCGCLATVLAADLLGRLKTGRHGRGLVIGTGALMNPMTVMQGQSVMGIAHLVEIACG